MHLLAMAMAALACAATASAQERWRGPSDEIRPFVGVFVPVGAQRADFKSATMVGVQAAAELTRHFHGVASLGWIHGHNRMFTNDVTHIWQFDGGFEANAVRSMAWGSSFRPFLGAGVGSRTYDYKDRQTKNTSCVAGYASLGAEIQHGVIAVRSEARDYLSCFHSPISGERRTRNDLGLTIGLAYNIR